MRFLRLVAGYRKTDEKRSIDSRQELNTLNLGEKVNEYQHNYSEYYFKNVNLSNPSKAVSLPS
jgi:hypothetical protein